MTAHSVSNDQESSADPASTLFVSRCERAEVLILRTHFADIRAEGSTDDQPAARGITNGGR
jgi:hypothetical protein